MSIDYDRLRAEIDRFDNGDEHDNYKADEWLYLNKSAIARELLRLHDGVGELADEYTLTATVCKHSNDPVGKSRAGTLQSVSMRLTNLLNGDTE